MYTSISIRCIYLYDCYYYYCYFGAARLSQATDMSVWTMDEAAACAIRSNSY